MVIAQETKHVLFLGNSYIYTNNMPAMAEALALSAGDTLTYQSNTPGGYTLNGHSTNATSLDLIEQGDWDFVVLQEQSQAPAFPITQVESDVFPYAELLDSLVRLHNPCAETVFFMTWGRENGDAANCNFWPPVCTYEGMDDLLLERYVQMASDNDAVVCAAGAVWRHIRENFPDIELYSADGSHPSAIGTYAIACSFYSTLFNKPASLITDNQGIDATTAQTIRVAVDEVIFNNPAPWFIGAYPLTAQFGYDMINENTVQFTSPIANADAAWNFGDGNTSNETNPTHQYAASGSYSVSLTLDHCDQNATHQETIVINSSTINQVTAPQITVYPNPSSDHLIIDGKDVVSFHIVNAQGQLVARFNKTALPFTLDLHNFSVGVYTIKLSDNSLSDVKFLVE
jgi:hypothetical protein